MRRRRVINTPPLSLELVADRLDCRHDTKRTERMDRRAAFCIRARSKKERPDTDRVAEEKPD